MAHSRGPDVAVDSAAAAEDTRLTENGWRWIEILRSICDNQVPAPNFPVDITMKELFGCGQGKCH